MRILILNEPEPINAVTHWRMYGPISLLEKTYPVEIRKNNGNPLSPWDFLWPDVVIGFRCSMSSQLMVLQTFKQVNPSCKIIIDYDDSFYNIPIYHDSYPTLHSSNSRFEECMTITDVLWVSTGYLKSEIIRISNCDKDKIWVIPNAVTESSIKAAKFNEVTEKVMWRGSMSHRYDVTKEACEQVYKACSEFIWFGYIPEWYDQFDVQPKVGFQPLVNAWQYFQIVQKIKPNIVWKPLSDISFNRAKSNIAWIEATLAGGVCLTNMNTDIWEFAIKIIDWDPDFLYGVWNESIIELLENYTLEDVNKLRYQTITI